MPRFVACVLALIVAGPAPGQSSVPELVRRLQNGDLLERQDAAFALAALGRDAESAVPALYQASNSPGLSKPAHDALRAIGPAGWHALFSHGGQGNESWIREAALGRYRLAEVHNAFVDLGDKLSPLARLPALPDVDAYADPQRLFRVAPSPLAVPHLILSLRKSDPHLRILAAKRLADLGPLARPAIGDLIAMLDNPWPLTPPPQYVPSAYYPVATYSLRLAAVKALLAIGPAGADALASDGVPRLMAGLQTDNFDVQLHTARALSPIGPSALPAAPLLARLLRESLIDRKTIADNPFARALVAIGPAAVPALAPLLSRREHSLVSFHALDAISELGLRARGHAGLVRAVLLDAEHPQREEAARVLARIAPDDPATIPALIQAVRLHRCPTAIGILALYGGRARAAIPVLRSLLDEERCGSDAVLALARIDPIFRAAAELDPRWSRPLLAAVWRVLAMVAVPDLLRRLDAKDEYDRHLAREALRRYGSLARPAVPVLLERMKQEESLPWAAPVLARIEPNHPAVVPALMAMLAYGDHWVRQGAAEELGRLGPAATPAISRLERLLDDRWIERQTFETALARITDDPRWRVATPPSAAERIGMLEAEVQRSSWHRDQHGIAQCATALADAGGPKARAALPLLWYLALDWQMQNERHQIETAIARIESRQR